MDNSKPKEEISSEEGNCSGWKRRTKVERYLIFACLILLLAFLLMIGLVLYMKTERNKRSSNSIAENNPLTDERQSLHNSNACNTPMCKYRAGSILTNIDLTANPCDDFYQFACGSYLKYENVYDESSNAQENVKYYMYYLSRDVLEKWKDVNHPQFVPQVWRYYQSCLNQPTDIKEMVKDFLTSVGLRGFPFQESEWTTSGFMEYAVALSLIHSKSQLLFKLTYDPNDSYFQIDIGSSDPKSPVFWDPTEENLDKKDKYVNMMKYLFTALNISEEDSNLLAEEITTFETSLSELRVKERNGTLTNLTIEQMHYECFSIDWNLLFTLWFKYLDHEEKYERENITLSVFSMEYIINLCNLITYDKRRIVYNLLVWKIVVPYLGLFDETFAPLKKNIPQYTEIHKLKWMTHWKTCINSMTGFIRMGLDYMLIKSIDPQKGIEECETYSRQILNTLDETFSKEDWVSDETRALLRKKAKEIQYYIGYTNISLNEELINQSFRNINMTESYVMNIIFEEKQLIADDIFNSETSMEKFIRKQNVHKPFTLEATYKEGRTNRRILIHLPLLFPPFYAYGSPQYLNYGGIGTIIGHELSRAFSFLDYSELFKELDFPIDMRNQIDDGISWPEDFVKKYIERKTCFIKQYFSEDLKNDDEISPHFSISYKDLADNIGVAVAYRTYEKYIKEHGEEPSLPGFDYTNRQMFFIAYAQNLCTTKAEATAMSYGITSSAKYRIEVPLMNLPEFSKVFHCPRSNSHMNPDRKCKVFG